MPTWLEKRFDDLTPAELHACLALRAAVFVVEQDCPYQDPDPNDPRARHLMGLEGGNLVAYARWYAEGDVMRLGRIVTSPEVRGRGLGREVVREALHRLGRHVVLISAQDHLRAWYEDLGFVAEGPVFLEDGIPHVAMRCTTLSDPG